ncbi:MAG: NUDIX hydrolase [Hyphomicrobiales bacterium]|nr:NUDIX hydrolase [Hyphomicrobiales bacterium]MDE2018439.1 NUDIX hydrolase [Hyphomicrobiales bacterium]
MSDPSRLHPPRPILAASLCVMRDGKALVARRGRPPGEGLWSLPGGAVEIGEGLREAAARETLEETGVEAAPVAFVDHVEVVERQPDGAVRRHFVVASFVGRWRAGEARPGPEASEIAWIDPLRGPPGPSTLGLAAILRRAAAIEAATP